MSKHISMLKGAALTGLLALFATAAAAQGSVHIKHKALQCTSCHTAENAVAGNPFVLPSTQTCIGCHGSMEDLAKKTAPQDPKDPNPHFSNHYGEFLQCTSCHAEHKESSVTCNNCHEFKFKAIR